MRTVKEDVKSGWSATVSGTTKAAAVTGPTLVATSTGMSMIRLSWTTVAGATGYEIEFLKGSYATEALFGAANLNRSKITVSGGSHRNYVHTGRTAGTRYSYRIRAKLAQGGESSWSTPAQQYTKPARPVLGASSAISTTVVLTWDTVKFFDDAFPGAESRLTDDANYQIQRRPATSSTWTNVSLSSACDSATNKCTVNDAPTGDDALKASTRYYYRIRAISSSGSGSLTSYWYYKSQQTSNQ